MTHTFSLLYVEVPQMVIVRHLIGSSRLQDAEACGGRKLRWPFSVINLYSTASSLKPVDSNSDLHPPGRPWKVGTTGFKLDAVYNHKGGVGKTTVSLNLSVCLAAAGYRCLLVDIDPQQSSTTVLSRTGASPNLVDVIRKQAVIEDALHETVVQNLWIIPSTRALTLLETGLDDRVRLNHGLKRYLTFSENRFDFIIIDCPPAMGLLSLSALTAAESVMIPTTSGAFSIQGVQRTIETVNALRGGLNPGLVVNGILISLFEGPRRDLQTVKDI